YSCRWHRRQRTRRCRRHSQLHRLAQTNPCDRALRGQVMNARLGLTRDDVVAATMRSPKQVELRAKARGLKIPQELIASHPSGVSLTRCENARAPVPGRGRNAGGALDRVLRRERAVRRELIERLS